MANNGPSYSEIIVKPYREELVQAGFQQLLTPEEVETALNRRDDKIALVVLNSVCGCSARVGRPGTILSLFNKVVPDLLFTIFAGMEKDAVNLFRQKYLAGITPSSPNIAIFKNGQLVHMLHRYQIERMGAGDIAAELVNVYDAHCTKEQSAETIEHLRQVFIEKYKADPLQLSNE
ncbi:MAG: BrxA/BrxB family bacilliredoxin [Bacteroidetes bacterium]|nr:BrxA/BrxB family bacilliredoxin [Bacteroidota bacterium]